jgi:hypothetical protein
MLNVMVIATQIGSAKLKIILSSNVTVGGVINNEEN